jgi:hypothetical protein
MRVRYTSRALPELRRYLDSEPSVPLYAELRGGWLYARVESRRSLQELEEVRGKVKSILEGHDNGKGVDMFIVGKELKAKFE